MRNRIVIDVSTGEQSVVPYTPEEEAEADAALAAAQAAANDPANFPLSDRQLRLGLIDAGVRPSAVRSAIVGAISDPLQQEAALTWFDYSKEVHWDHPQTQQFMALAGFTEAQAKAMWLAARSIPA